MKLLVATNNSDKYREMEELLTDLPVNLHSLQEFPEAPEVEEDRDTFAGNAAKKASEMARLTQMPAVADDSGLCVDALDGAPGVYSARYAGPNGTYRDVCKKLIREMRRVPDGKRQAHFTCQIAMADAEGNIRLRAEGKCEGKIIREMRGGRGFGYDPVFLYLPAGKTFAQMVPEEKHKFSHRGKAMRAFCKKLSQFIEDPDAFPPETEDEADGEYIDFEEWKEQL